ncbi:unnamed protein product [Ectocarpus sp. 4 AP-2014]
MSASAGEEGPWGHSNIFREPTDPEMTAYLGRKRESLQNEVVNVAQGMSIGPALYLWTHRLTCADVVSVVTTTRPSTSASTTTTTHKTKYIAGGGLPVGSVDGGRGVLRRGPPFDGSFGRLEGGGKMPLPRRASGKWTIVPKNKEGSGEGGFMAFKGGKTDAELRRLRNEKNLRAPLHLPLFTSPLEVDPTGSGKVHDRMSECLMAERERFMELLGKERQERVHLEAFACSLVQAAFRGYLLRKRWAEVDARQRVRLRVRKSLRDFLKSRGAPFALGALEKQQKEDRLRQAGACTIQASFRCFLARQTLGKRRLASFLFRRRRAARTLQCWGRYLFASRRLRVTAHRRRVVHSIAASMIQQQWRLRKTLEQIQEVTKSRLFRSAAAIQRIVRGYVARKKVGRQLTRVRGLRKTRAVYILQKFIRRAQARQRVRRLQRRRRRGTRARAALHVQRVCRGFVGRRRAAARKKAATLDIWRAAREGNASRVDALYYGQGLGGVIFDCLNTKDPEGNSLLAKVASGVGPIALIRVVLKWGADVNAVNIRGESALQLAMSRRNAEVVDLLVNHPNIHLNQDQPGKSILHEAAALGLHHLSAQLVSKGLDVNGVDPQNGWTPVHYACHYGRDELARLLTSRSGTMVNFGGAGGVTPMHLAAAGGWEKCATNLLENNASPVVKNDKGQVPAVVAMLHGHASTGKMLLQAFSAAKTASKRSRTIDAFAAVAMASGVTHAVKPVVDAADKDENRSGGGQGSEKPGAEGGGGAGDGLVGLEGITIPEVATADVAEPAVAGEGVSDHNTPDDAGSARGDRGLGAADEGGSELLNGRPHSATSVGEQAGSTGSDAGVDGGGRGGDAVSVQSNASSRASVSLEALSRRASTAGVAMDLNAIMLEDLVPSLWDDDDIRCAVTLAERGEAWCLASLFALGLDPDCQHPDSGDTIGIAAARGGDRETLEVCLETGVSFATKNRRGRSALHAAVVRDDLEVAALLLANPGLSGIEVDDLCDPDEDGRTPLHEMAARGEAPTVLLLATEADSEWTNGGSGGEGTESGNASLDTRSDDASSAPGAGGGGGNDSSSGDDFSSSCVTAASSVVVDDQAGGVGGDHGARKGSGSSIPVSGGDTGVADGNAGDSAKRMSDIAAVVSAAAAPDTPAPSSVRSPLPLSAFAAPSLADTEELRDLRHHYHDVTNAASRVERPEGVAIDTARAGSTSTTTNVNSRSSLARKASSSGDTRDTARSGGNHSYYGGDDHDDSSGSEVRSEGEEGDNPSGWGGLLEVDMRCSGSGNCPLHEAAASGKVGAVLSLLDLGADVSVANGCGDTALHVAVGPNAPRDPMDEGHSWGSTLVSTSLSTLSTTSSSMVVGTTTATTTITGDSRGSGEAQDAMALCDDDGRGPTTQARKGAAGHLSKCHVVTALLRRGADPSKKNRLGQTAAMCAVLAGRAGALREVRKAALLGHSSSKGKEKEEMSDLGHMAIREGHVACLRVLTESCSEQEVLAWTDEEGVSALALAVARGQRECIDILLKGASPTTPCGGDGGGGGGNTVLHVTAMARGGVPVLKRLMSPIGGGEPFDLGWLEYRNDLGDTVLMAALRAGRHSAALLLLQALAVPTAAAHTFRYAWVVAAALRLAELCPCPSCVLGRTADERARLCSKIAPKPTRPGEQPQGSHDNPLCSAGASAAAVHRRLSRANSTASKAATTASDGAPPAFVVPGSNPRRLRQLPRQRPGVAAAAAVGRHLGRRRWRRQAKEACSSPLGGTVQGKGGRSAADGPMDVGGPAGWKERRATTTTLAAAEAKSKRKPSPNAGVGRPRR